MNHHSWFVLVVFAMCLSSGRGADADGVPFRALAFDAAATAAKTEQKIVFIDFYTTWCAPCKMLDDRTWKDPTVANLLAEKAVSLRLDAEKEGRDLATKYKVTAYPTLLLLKPDGSEVDRLVGFREAADFVREFNSALAGKPSLTRARETAQRATSATLRDQVTARETLARELMQKGKYEEALSEYLWLYDTGMKQEPGFAGVRNSFLTSEMGRLAKRYPPAAEALARRRDDARARLLADAPDRAAAGDFGALSDALGDTKGMMAVFDGLPAGDPRRRGFGLRAYRVLVEERRYNDAVEVHPYAMMESLFEHLTQAAGSAAAHPELRTNALRTAAMDVEALAGAGDLDHATALRDRILAADSSEATKSILREHLTRAGHPDLAP